LGELVNKISLGSKSDWIGSKSLLHTYIGGMDLDPIEPGLMDSSTRRSTVIGDKLQDFLFRQCFWDGTAVFHGDCRAALQRDTRLFSKDFWLCCTTKSPQLEIDKASSLVNFVHDRFPSSDLLLGVDSRHIVLIARFGGNDGSLCDEQSSRSGCCALRIISLANVLMDVVVRGAISGERRLSFDVSYSFIFLSFLPTSTTILTMAIREERFMSPTFSGVNRRVSVDIVAVVELCG
jgi:hypothetical protein